MPGGYIYDGTIESVIGLNEDTRGFLISGSKVSQADHQFIVDRDLAVVRCLIKDSDDHTKQCEYFQRSLDTFRSNAINLGEHGQGDFHGSVVAAEIYSKDANHKLMHAKDVKYLNDKKNIVLTSLHNEGYTHGIDIRYCEKDLSTYTISYFAYDKEQKKDCRLIYIVSDGASKSPVFNTENLELKSVNDIQDTLETLNKLFESVVDLGLSNLIDGDGLISLDYTEKLHKIEDSSSIKKHLDKILVNLIANTDLRSDIASALSEYPRAISDFLKSLPSQNFIKNIIDISNKFAGCDNKGPRYLGYFLGAYFRQENWALNVMSSDDDFPLASIKYIVDVRLESCISESDNLFQNVSIIADKIQSQHIEGLSDTLKKELFSGCNNDSFDLDNLAELLEKLYQLDATILIEEKGNVKEASDFSSEFLDKYFPAELCWSYKYLFNKIMKHEGLRNKLESLSYDKAKSSQEIILSLSKIQDKYSIEAELFIDLVEDSLGLTEDKKQYFINFLSSYQFGNNKNHVNNLRKTLDILVNVPNASVVSRFVYLDNKYNLIDDHKGHGVNLYKLGEKFELISNILPEIFPQLSAGQKFKLAEKIDKLDSIVNFLSSYKTEYNESAPRVIAAILSNDSLLENINDIADMTDNNKAKLYRIINYAEKNFDDLKSNITGENNLNDYTAATGKYKASVYEGSVAYFKSGNTKRADYQTSLTKANDELDSRRLDKITSSGLSRTCRKVANFIAEITGLNTWYNGRKRMEGTVSSRFTFFHNHLVEQTNKVTDTIENFAINVSTVDDTDTENQTDENLGSHDSTADAQSSFTWEDNDPSLPDQQFSPV